MTENVLPASPTGSRFGWPQPARIEEFKKLLASPTGATTRIVFQGNTVDIPIIRVPIELPKYRLAKWAHDIATSRISRDQAQGSWRSFLGARTPGWLASRRTWAGLAGKS